ncbi:MAG: hypothetical protein JNM62_13465 [Flavobacteriales bacterium]|nr:hypothetical protein [Flavobacteriales bacterium]
MSVFAEVVDPGNGNPVTIEYTWQEGFILVDSHMDTDWNRFHIAFFVASPGAKAGTRSFDSPTDPKGYGEHSLIAIAVIGNKVVHKDRKLVKDLVGEGMN